MAQLWKQVLEFFQGILENKVSDYITRERVAILMSFLFWVMGEFYNLTLPNKVILVFAAFALTLIVANQGTKLWDWWKRNSTGSTGPSQELPIQSTQPEPEQAATGTPIVQRVPPPAVRDAIRYDLKLLFTRGYKLLSLYESSKLADEEAWQEWVQDMNTFLQNSPYESYVTRWDNHDGIKPHPPLPPEVPGRNRKLWADIYFRLKRIEEFLAELKDQV